MTRSFDVAIVGAGPAGSTAARVLAEGGARVVVLEKSEFPRMKICGGGVVRRAAPLLPAGITLRAERELSRVVMRFLEPAGPSSERPSHSPCDPSSSATPIEPAQRAPGVDRAPAPLAFEVARETPVVSLVMRRDFDTLLARAAIESGADVRFGTALQAIRRAGDVLELATSRGSVTARFVVGADGALGSTAKLAGWREPLSTIPALEAEIELAPRDLERFEGRATFDFGAIEAGYGWLFPKSAHLSAGVLTTRRGPAGLRRELDRYLALAGAGAARSLVVHGSVIPVRPRAEGLARDGVLLVGDAAGLADPLTLEGISIAMRSAAICAESILDHGARAGEAYERRLRPSVLAELACARRLAWLVYEAPRVTRALFRRAGQPLCEAMTDVIAGERTYRELLARSSHWWALARSLAVRPGRDERGLLEPEPARARGDA